MENHFHLFLQTPLGNLSRIMHFINTAYTAYFNKMHERNGHLFQGRYKAILVDADEYAQELSRYIHLNPVRAKIIQLPEQYRWSSYREYIGLRETPVWLHPEFILSYFGKTIDRAGGEYATYVNSILNKPIKNPFEGVGHSNILGSDLFVERVKKICIGDRNLDREVPGLRSLNSDLNSEPTFDEIKAVTEKVLGKRTEYSKKVEIFLTHKYTGSKLKEIGKIFGLSISGVSSVMSRLEKGISQDLIFGQKVKEIEEKLFFRTKQ
jgi:putative transposase